MLIAVEGMTFYAYHGYYPQEQIVGGRYTIDVYITLNNTQAAYTDNLNHTVNYEQILAICQQQMQTPKRLVETVAQQVLDEISGLSPQINHTKVRITKHYPPMNNLVEKIFIEIEKKRRKVLQV